MSPQAADVPNFAMARRRWTIGLFIAACLTLAVVAQWRAVPASERVRGLALQRQFADLPVYPRAEAEGPIAWFDRGTRTGAGRSYLTDSAPAVLLQFYEEASGTAGWHSAQRPDGEPVLSMCREGVELVVDARRAAGAGRQFSVDLVWEGRSRCHEEHRERPSRP